MAATTSSARRSVKGRRPKHVPQRMCVSCREHAAKRTLTRVVRTPEGTVEIDPTGKRNGRGAYLCDQPACWGRALTGGGLARALRTDIDAEVAGRLRHHAAALPRAGATATTAREEES